MRRGDRNGPQMMNHWYQSGYRDRLIRLSLIVAGLFLVLVFLLIFWGALRVPFLAAREDNPRTVEQELRVVRGGILDANEVILARNEGPAERQRRVYPLPIAEPVIGYYSLRFGTAGVEEALDEILRGTTTDPGTLFRRELLNEPAAGRDVRLTLDISLQANAVRLLGGRQGALVLLSLPGGAIRAMASLPSYDPNQFDTQFETLAGDATGPLLNRVTQGQYQPGLILQPFLAASLLESGELVVADLPAEWEGENPGTRLAESLTVDTYRASLASFGLLSRPDVPLAVAEVPDLNVDDLSRAVLGEETLTVSPLQVALAAAVLGTNGVEVNPQLVSGVRVGDRWEAFNTQAGQAGSQIITPETAANIRDRLSQHGNIADMSSTVLAGPAMTNSWYIGLAPATAPRFVVVVVLEKAEDGESAARVGRRLLEIALE